MTRSIQATESDTSIFLSAIETHCARQKAICTHIDELTAAQRRIVNAAGEACETNFLALRTVGAEMKAVAARSVRMKNSVRHIILRWPDGRRRSDER